MVGRPPRICWSNALEAHGSQIELIDKDLNHANRIVLAYVVIQAAKQKRELCSILAFDESLHDKALQKRVAPV